MGNDIFSNLLEPEDENIKKSDLDVLNELFSGKGIETRTELNDRQIVAINQKRGLASLLGFDDLHDLLNDFMLLNVSRNRKGRAEFVDSFKAQREQEINKSQGGFFNGLKGKLGFQ